MFLLIFLITGIYAIRYDFKRINETDNFTVTNTLFSEAKIDYTKFKSDGYVNVVLFNKSQNLSKIFQWHSKQLATPLVYKNKYYIVRGVFDELFENDFRLHINKLHYVKNEMVRRKMTIYQRKSKSYYHYNNLWCFAKEFSLISKCYTYQSSFLNL
jgi:hypothetical protein